MPKLRYVTPSYQAAAAQFIFTELDTAMTFCEMARATRDLEAAERNARDAERALGAAWRLEQRVPLTKSERQEFARITLRLSSLLDEIRKHNAQVAVAQFDPAWSPVGHMRREPAAD